MSCGGEIFRASSVADVFGDRYTRAELDQPDDPRRLPERSTACALVE